jgi:type I restriction enzyme M protein
VVPKCSPESRWREDMATTADGKAGIDLQEIERRLWDSADELRANSGLKESEYSVPVLGLIFLKFTNTLLSSSRLPPCPNAKNNRKPHAP